MWTERGICQTVGLKVLNRRTINDVCKDMTPCSLSSTLQTEAADLWHTTAHNTHDIATERVVYHGILIVPFPTISNSNMADVRWERNYNDSATVRSKRVLQRSVCVCKMAFVPSSLSENLHFTYSWTAAKTNWEYGNWYEGDSRPQCLECTNQNSKWPQQHAPTWNCTFNKAPTLCKHKTH